MRLYLGEDFSLLDDVVVRYNDGETISSIARSLKIGEFTLRGWLRTSGVTLEKRLVRNAH